MALPKLNDVPKYSLTIPSTNKQISYRPFLVKEQKILLMALESQDEKQILESIVGTIDACTFGQIDTSSLALFDLEYIFLQLRTKSVGEGTVVNLKCQDEKCREDVPVQIDIESIIFDKMPNNRIKINEQYTIELKYPNYKTSLELLGSETTITDRVYKTALDCLDNLLTEEEVIDFKEHSEKEKKEFVESLTATQFENVIKFVNEIPSLKKNVEYTCQKCNKKHKVTLEGLNDFLF